MVAKGCDSLASFWSAMASEYAQMRRFKVLLRADDLYNLTVLERKLRALEALGLRLIVVTCNLSCNS